MFITQRSADGQVRTSAGTKLFWVVKQKPGMKSCVRTL